MYSNLHYQSKNNKRLPPAFICNQLINSIFLGIILFAQFDDSAADNLQTLSQPDIQIELPIPIPAHEEQVGGLITHDLDGDGLRDFLVTRSGIIVAVRQDGRILWRRDVDIQVNRQSEVNGLPGHHAPGIQADDVTDDGKVEVLYLTHAGELHIVSGESGELLRSIKIPSPEGTERWEHLIIANFRGQGNRDLLLQTTNAEGYRMGRYLAAYAIEELVSHDNPEPLWTRDDFLAAAHNGARLADLNGDGRDEVISSSIIGPDGTNIYELPVRGHIDAVQIADILPDSPGLEIVALEEGGRIKPLPFKNAVADWLNWNINKLWGAGNRVFLFNMDGLIWQRHYFQQEPQNAAVGNFDPDVNTLEIWNRSRYNLDQKPFVFNADGQLISHYEMIDVAPDDWTRAGVEVINTIHWSGSGQQHAVAKERHKNGDVVIFDPVSGEFKIRIPEQANRLYVADVLGDWREEIIVLSVNNVLRIYSNHATNPNPDHASLWDMQHYRRSKQTWNYYSP